MVLVAVGLFALGEALYVASKLRHGPVELIPVSKGKNAWLSKEDWKRSWKPWLRGTFIGFPFGTVPAGGADISTFLSYAAERKLAKGANKAQFGKGAIEGVAGPEAANNAAAAGVLVPLLTLGIPTTATAAMMLTAFQRYGSSPVRSCSKPGRACLDPDRVAVRRQPHAAGAEPAPGGPVGEDPADPAALPYAGIWSSPPSAPSR